MLFLNQSIQICKAGIKPACDFVPGDLLTVLSLSESHSYESIDGHHQSLLI